MSAAGIIIRCENQAVRASAATSLQEIYPELELLPVAQPKSSKLVWEWDPVHAYGCRENFRNDLLVYPPNQNALAACLNWIEANGKSYDMVVGHRYTLLMAADFGYAVKKIPA